MFELKIDMSQYERVAAGMNAAQDQVPFALSLALNRAAQNTRELLIQEWPQFVRAKQPGFIRYALRRSEPATKNNLRVEIYDQTGKRFVRRLETGGTHAARGGNLAIPVESHVKVGAHGVRKSQLPRNLPNAVVINRSGRLGIYQRTGRKKKKLKLMYLLRPSVQVPAKIPFHDDFWTSMLAECSTSFPAAMARAMKSRRT